MTTIKPEEAGGFLKRIREKKGLRQSELAKRLGISSGSLSMIESGERRFLPTHEQAIKNIISVFPPVDWSRWRIKSYSPLTQEQELELCARYSTGEHSRRTLARRFKISLTTTLEIMRRHNCHRRTAREGIALAYGRGEHKNLKQIQKQPRVLISPAKAYLLGTLISDGYLSEKEGYIALGVIDKEFINTFGSAVTEVYGLKDFTIRSVFPTDANHHVLYKIEIHSVLMVRDLLPLGPFGTFSWRIPHRVRKASMKARAAYLRAFFDAEGSATFAGRGTGFQRNVTATSANSNIESIGHLLLDFGIHSRCRPWTNREGRHYWTLVITGRRNLESFARDIGFTIGRKQRDLLAATLSYKQYQRDKGAWKGPELVKQEYLTFSGSLGHHPSLNEFTKAGRYDLLNAIRRYHGGLPAFRARFFGLERTRINSPVTKGEENQIRRLRQRGWTIRELSSKFRCSSSAVFRVIHSTDGTSLAGRRTHSSRRSCPIPRRVVSELPQYSGDVS